MCRPFAPGQKHNSNVCLCVREKRSGGERLARANNKERAGDAMTDKKEQHLAHKNQREELLSFVLLRVVVFVGFSV